MQDHGRDAGRSCGFFKKTHCPPCICVYVHNPHRTRCSFACHRCRHQAINTLRYTTASLFGTVVNTSSIYRSDRQHGRHPAADAVNLESANLYWALDSTTSRSCHNCRRSPGGVGSLFRKKWRRVLHDTYVRNPYRSI